MSLLAQVYYARHGLLDSAEDGGSAQPISSFSHPEVRADVLRAIQQAVDAPTSSLAPAPAAPAPRATPSAAIVPPTPRGLGGIDYRQLWAAAVARANARFDGTPERQLVEHPVWAGFKARQHQVGDNMDPAWARAIARANGEL